MIIIIDKIPWCKKTPIFNLWCHAQSNRKYCDHLEKKYDRKDEIVKDNR